MTIRRKLLDVIPEGVFTAEDLTVLAFRAHPKDFCLDGFPQYPDSNQVKGIIMGKVGLVAKGNIARVAPNKYRKVKP